LSRRSSVEDWVMGTLPPASTGGSDREPGRNSQYTLAGIEYIAC
jgi:hypothetical protein